MSLLKKMKASLFKSDKTASKPIVTIDNATIEVSNNIIRGNAITKARLANYGVTSQKIMKNYKYPIDEFPFFGKDQWVLTPDNTLGIIKYDYKYPSNYIEVESLDGPDIWIKEYYGRNLVKVPTGSKLKTVLTLYGKAGTKDKWPIKK